VRRIRGRPRPDGPRHADLVIDACLVESAEPGEGRSAGFERVIRPAAFALAVAQDAVNVSV
jgi:hypothetical protein